MLEHAPTIPVLDRISDYVVHWAGLTPDRVAIRFEGRSWTYAELEAEVDRWAAALVAQGIAPGDRVAMLSTPRPEFFFSFLATVSIGAVWLGLNPRYTPSELARTLADAEPALVFSLDAFEGVDLAGRLGTAAQDAGRDGDAIVFGGAADEFERLESFLTQADELDRKALDKRRAAVSRDDAALIVYTSGSTGVPKGAVLPHRGLCFGYSSQSAHFRLEGAKILCNLPINHIGCAGDLSCGPLVAGGTILFMERFAPDEVVAALAAGDIDCLLGIPTILQMLSDMPEFEALDMSRMRLVCWGGAAIAANVLARYRAKGCPLALTYGMSEVPGSITLSALGADDRELLTTVGRPAEGLDIRLVKDDGALCEIGEEGEIRIRHESLMLGYFKRPDLTAEAYDENGYFRSGDVGAMEPEGTVRLVGRKKEMFKSGGYNVYPREIEMVLESHPEIETAAVVSVPDETWQEIGWAYVIADAGADAGALAEELAALCREKLANYKRPKKIVVRDALPMLPVGKVDKVSLRKEALGE